MQAAYDGYSPSASNLEYVQAQIFASFAADLAILCSDGATELFRSYATDLVGIPYQQGVSAQALVSVSAQTSAGTIATTSAGLSVGGPIVSIPVVALSYGIAAGTITINDPTGLNPQVFTTSGALAGDTGISVSSLTPGFAYPAGSTIAGTQAYYLPALSQFSLDSLGFVNFAPSTISAGTTQSVTLTAVQSGAIFNGAGQGGNVQSVQAFNWVNGVSLITAASGGVDPEDDPHYLNRVKIALQLQAPRPITATDFGTMAGNFVPYPGTDQQEVGRATAVDGYDPSNATFGNSRMVAVCVTDQNGHALNDDTLYGYPNGSSGSIVTTIPSPNAGWGIAGWLESLREINFLVNVINPTYSAIYVTATVKAGTGWDATSVQQNVQSALLAYLSPASWGLPSSSESGWINGTTIFQSHLLSVVQSASGVDHVVPGTLKFGLAPTPSNIVDLLLPGPVALPTSTVATIPTSAITVT